MTKARRSTDIESVRLDIEQRGARIVYESLLEVCQDKGASAQARAASGVAILRAGGLFDAKRRPADDADPAEMSADELRQVLPRLQRDLERLEGEIVERQVRIDALDADEDEDDVDIFA